MNFEEKVKSMKASEIITAMVDGLKTPVVNVDMGSFGDMRVVGGKEVC